MPDIDMLHRSAVSSGVYRKEAPWVRVHSEITVSIQIFYAYCFRYIIYYIYHTPWPVRTFDVIYKVFDFLLVYDLDI